MLPNASEVVLRVRFGELATPVPLRPTVVVLPLVELLEIVTAPVKEFAEVGVKDTCSVSDCPGESVAGNEPAIRLKPVPEIEAELTVTGAVPEEVSASYSTDEVFTETLPKLMELVPTKSCGVPVEPVVVWKTGSTQ